MMSDANIGIHSMKDEHFGIGIVEMMASGLLTIAHKSGGPLLDIIKHQENGYLASDATEYAQIMLSIIHDLSSSDLADIRSNARLDSDRFNDKKFVDGFDNVLHRLEPSLLADT